MLVIHSSLTDSSNIGIIRKTPFFKTSNLIEDAIESIISIESTDFNSQVLILNAKGIAVKAPTGQRSIICQRVDYKNSFR